MIMDSIVEWAENEFNIACEQYRKKYKEMVAKEEPIPDCNLFDDDIKIDDCPFSYEYMSSIYKAALHAFQAANGGETWGGLSWKFITEILIRLMNSQPLTPITEEDFFKYKSPFDYDLNTLARLGLKSRIQCQRLSSLFRDEELNGKIVYRDVDRDFCYDREHQDRKFHFSLLSGVLDELFPITMPYIPSLEPYRLECSSFLFDRRNGEFDTVALWNIYTPEGKKVEVNRFWKAGPNIEEIDQDEYNIRYSNRWSQA